MENGYLPDPFFIETSEQTVLNQMGQGTVKELVDPAGGDKPRKHRYVVSTTEVRERPITRKITKMFRVKNPDGQFLYYNENLEGSAFSGKYVDLSRVVGKYEEPIFAIDMDRATGNKTVTGIRRKEARYEIPFGESFIDPSTGEQTTLEDLPKDVLCKYYVTTTDRKYALPSISLDEFVNKPFEELVEYGKTGKWPEQTTIDKGKKNTVRGRVETD